MNGVLMSSLLGSQMNDEYMCTLMEDIMLSS